jgi:hypothetical protein
MASAVRVAENRPSPAVAATPGATLRVKTRDRRRHSAISVDHDPVVSAEGFDAPQSGASRKRPEAPVSTHSRTAARSASMRRNDPAPRERRIRARPAALPPTEAG